jgi:[protein-PII] uridylyltransferase
MNPVAFAVDDLREQYTQEMALVRQTCERTGDGTAAIPPPLCGGGPSAD